MERPTKEDERTRANCYWIDGNGKRHRVNGSKIYTSDGKIMIAELTHGEDHIYARARTLHDKSIPDKDLAEWYGDLTIGRNIETQEDLEESIKYLETIGYHNTSDFLRDKLWEWINTDAPCCKNCANYVEEANGLCGVWLNEVCETNVMEECFVRRGEGEGN